MASAAEIAQWSNGKAPAPATLPKVAEAEARPVTRRKPNDPNSITETMPALGVSQRVRDFVHIGREVGIFAILLLIFYYVLLPQNQQSIENQKALQTQIARCGEINAKWGDIVDKMASNETKFQTTLLAISESVNNSTAETRKLRQKLEEFLDKK